MNLFSPQICRWHPFPDTPSLFVQVTGAVAALARTAMAQRGAFHVVLAGGNTPRSLYEKLRAIETDWSKWHIYYGDERCLPPDDPERNSFMADQAWLNHVAIPRQQIHPIPAERGATDAARDYAVLLREVDMFDLVLLGLGEDGHTASLFPGHDWGVGPEAPAALAVSDAPKPPPARVSLSAWRLSRARQVLFLVTGTAKRNAIAGWRTGKPIPARAITPPDGVDIWLESRAAPP